MKKLSMDELNRISPEEFKKKEKNPVILVLDNIRSMNNIGSIFRTADAFRLNGVYLCGITATPPHREIHKTALGATESVEWNYFNNTTEAINELKLSGYTIIAIEQTDKSMDLANFSPEEGKNYAIIFGNEVKGVEDGVLELCDLCLEIPQFGTKHSLNVAVTAGIVVYSVLQKL